MSNSGYNIHDIAFKTKFCIEHKSMSQDIHTHIPEKLYTMMEKYLAMPKVLNRPVMVDLNRMSEEEFTRGSDGVARLLAMRRGRLKPLGDV